MKNKIKIYLYLTWFLRALVFLGIIHGSYTGGIGMTMFLVILFGASFLPLFYPKIHKRFHIAWLIEILFLALTSFHLLGVSASWYSTLFFDDFLHFSGGFILGLFSISLLFTAKKAKHIKLDIFLISLFSLTLVISLGVFWEIFEFFWDLLFTVGTGLQRSQPSVADTIRDILWDFVGGIFATIFVLEGYRKNKKAKWLYWV